MQIEIQTNGETGDDLVVTVKVDEAGMTEIRGHLAQHGNDEIRAIFDEADTSDHFHHVKETGTTTDHEGNTVPVVEDAYIDAYRVTLPQAARAGFVDLLRGIGAGGHADALDEQLNA